MGYWMGDTYVPDQSEINAGVTSQGPTMPDVPGYWMGDTFIPHYPAAAPIEAPVAPTAFESFAPAPVPVAAPAPAYELPDYNAPAPVAAGPQYTLPPEALLALDQYTGVYSNSGFQFENPYEQWQGPQSIGTGAYALENDPFASLWTANPNMNEGGYVVKSEFEPYVSVDYTTGERVLDFNRLNAAQQAAVDASLAAYNSQAGWDRYRKVGDAPNFAGALASGLGMTPAEFDAWAIQNAPGMYGMSTPGGGAFSGAVNPYVGQRDAINALVAEYGLADNPQVQGFLAQTMPILDAGAEEYVQRTTAQVGIGDVLKGAAFALGGVMGGPAGWALTAGNLMGRAAGIDPLIMAGLSLAAGQLGGSPTSGFDQVGDMGAAGYEGMMNRVAGGAESLGMIDQAMQAWNAMPSWQKQALQLGGKTAMNLASGEEIDPMQLGFGAALTGAGAYEQGAFDLGSTEAAPPTGYMSDIDLGSYADMALPADDEAFLRMLMDEDFDMTAAAQQTADTLSEAELDEFERMLLNEDFSLTELASPEFSDVLSGLQTGLDQYGAGEFGAGDYAAGEGATMQSIEEPIPAGQETFGDEYGAEAAPAAEEPAAEAPAEEPAADETGFNIKPTTIIKIAQALYGPLGTPEARAQEQALKAVTEREYANEQERQAAYFAYAQELLNFVPSVSEAYALDPQNVNTQFGNTFVDPATGEVRYELTPGTQEYFDALMQGAKDALDQGLGVDSDTLTADQLEKMIASLQGKRDKDMATLTRALYARGLLGLVTYQGAGENLLTGETETWALPEGQGVNPYFAAELARRERENYELSKMARSQAEDYITQLLNHSGGLLGQARDVDQQMVEALFQAGEYTDAAGNAKKRQGRGLYDLVAGPGGSYLKQLMGALPSGKAAAALADADMLEQLQREEAIRRFLEEQGL